MSDENWLRASEPKWKFALIVGVVVFVILMAVRMVVGELAQPYSAISAVVAALIGWAIAKRIMVRK